MDEDQRFDAAEQLALIERQQEAVVRAVGVDPRLVYGAWGVAWLVGLGLAALAHGDDPVLRVPPALPAVVLGVLLTAAGVLTAAHSVRASRGISGPSTVAGVLYGWAWLLSFVALSAVNSAVLRASGDPALADVLWPATSGLLVGVMHLFGAAVWREPLQFGVGAWLLLTTSVGAFLGLPALLWVMALGGGGGFLAVAAWFALRRRAR
ncbi:ABC transporter permease [Kineococcus auxinigenes]|uniref:ABC transporter permease n=1 Tax=unclassified Kineococcus TaxID=2621656 RepID=UPI003D7DF5BC